MKKSLVNQGIARPILLALEDNDESDESYMRWVGLRSVSAEGTGNR
jgi:hypothetical protein